MHYVNVRLCANAKSGPAVQEVLMADVNKVKAWRRGRCSEMETNEELSHNSARGLEQKKGNYALNINPQL